MIQIGSFNFAAVAIDARKRMPEKPVSFHTTTTIFGPDAFGFPLLALFFLPQGNLWLPERWPAK